MIFIDNLDLQLNFLEGNPIEFDDSAKIYKVSFSTINKKHIGYYTYNQIITMLCLTQEDIIKYSTNENIDVFTFIAFNAYQSFLEKEKNESESLKHERYFIDELLMVFRAIFDDIVLLDVDNGMFIIGKQGATLNKSNFSEFQSIIKKRNCLETIEEDVENPANEMARMLLEKRKKARENLAKAKMKSNGEDEIPLTIVDLISIFSEAEHMPLDQVFQYDIFQFNDQFNRMKMFRDYSVNIQALLAGAKGDDIEFKHWLSKTK